ncbi:MAG TPA: bifunctional acetate--CoA ligase family protein/GNAT family N-acetyltransferase [Dehalococcoidales bacterium]|nr:bifunctional acetate--CoA ligase family protein/GNAT family N-acetyltransferase [Dehalococcoidales bacterium]
MENISLFFNPGSVALVGAREKEGTVGRSVLENLLLAKDKRKIYPVNPNREKLLDIECYPDISSLPEVPDLAIIVTNAEIVPDMVKECGKAGVKAIIIISSGFKEIGAKGKAREDRVAEIASEYNISIIGPNCLGVINPSANLNASFATKMSKPGRIAFLSQSGALGTAVLDWAVSREIGFSAFVSLGSMLDVDFGDLIDYFGEDPETKSIIIYLESFGSSLKNARKFMSAARGFARTKPVIIIKAGKFQESVQAAKSHTGSMVGEDLYYDAAFDRAGVVRVEEIEDLFNCASILNTTKLPKEPNLAIITNAGGPAILATDALISRGGKLAQLSEETLSALNEFLPAYWSKANPIDVGGDVDPQKYLKTIEITLNDPGVNGAVMIYAPQGVTGPVGIAKTLIKYAKKSSKPILTSMMGSEDVAKARQMLYENNIPTYEFPEEAIKTYLYMYQYARNLETLYETPEDLPLDVGAPKNYLKILTHNTVAEGRTLLNEEDSKKLLATYGIAVTTPHFARNAEEAAFVASGIGYPVVMKISSPDVAHKSDVGGVILNIASADELKKAFAEIMANVKKHQPDARIEGVSIQKMVTRFDYELIIGSKKDPILGPVVIFGLGGTETEFFKDVSAGLPPLNQRLARRMLERTKVYKLLAEGFRAKPPVNLRLLDETLVRVSNLIVDFPEIKELDINPLVISGDTTIALDARIVLDKEATQKEAEEYAHLIISPYPTKYIQSWRCRDGRDVVLRPIRPEDEPLEQALIEGLSKESSRFRFFYILKDINHDMLSRFCNIDYDREMAIIAEYTTNGRRRNVGVGRLIVEPGGGSGEFAIVVADDFQNNDLGLKLCDMLIGIAQEKGLRNIYGIVLSDNWKMLGLVKKLGFTVKPLPEGETRVTLEL